MVQDPLRAQYPDARDWTVVRTFHHLAHVSVRVADTDSIAPWISRLRRTCPILQQRSPAGLLEEVRRSGKIDLGTLDGREAYRLTILLQREGFDIQGENVSFVSYFPRVAGMGVIIKDEAESQAFCLQLISEGATVEYIEA